MNLTAFSRKLDFAVRKAGPLRCVGRIVAFIEATYLDFTEQFMLVDLDEYHWPNEEIKPHWTQ
jgi:hypothetical protein